MTESTKRRITNIFYTLFAPVLLLVIWQLASNLNLVNGSILPSPVRIFTKFIDLFLDGKLISNLLVSITRVLIGFAIGSVLGISIGIILGLFNKLYRGMTSLIGILRPVPMIAWIPILILGLGIQEASKITVIVIGTFWPVLLNTIQGIQNIDKNLLDVAVILEKNKRTILKKVVIPSAIPSIMTGLRIGSSTAWSCVVAAEMIAASKGIGYMIMYAREMSQPATIFVGVFVIGLIGLGIDKLFARLERRFFKWNYIGKKD